MMNRFGSIPERSSKIIMSFKKIDKKNKTENSHYAGNWRKYYKQKVKGNEEMKKEMKYKR